MVERNDHLSLVEEQVAQGHDVTLIAPGDSKTSAKTGFILPKIFTRIWGTMDDASQSFLSFTENC